MLKYREEKLQEINIVYQILGIRCTLWNMFPFWMRSYILWTLLSMQSKIKKKNKKQIIHKHHFQPHLHTHVSRFVRDGFSIAIYCEYAEIFERDDRDKLVE